MADNHLNDVYVVVLHRQFLHTDALTSYKILQAGLTKVAQIARKHIYARVLLTIYPLDNERPSPLKIKLGLDEERFGYSANT